MTLSDIRFQRDFVAAEAFAAPIRSFKETFTRVLPRLADSLQEFVGQFRATDRSATFLLYRDGISEVIKQNSYVDLSPVTAFVPQGMISTYIDYALDLDQACQHAAEVPDRLMLFTNELAQIISLESIRISSKTGVKTYQDFGAQRDKLTAQLARHFKNGSHKTEVTYADVVSRNADWRDVFDLMEQITKKINSVDRTKLNKNLTNAVTMMDKFAAMGAKDKLGNISPEMSYYVAEAAYQIAAELEFFALTYYRAMALTVAINDTNNKLDGWKK